MSSSGKEVGPAVGLCEARVCAHEQGRPRRRSTLNDFEKALREQGRFEKLLAYTVQMAKKAGLLSDEIETAQDSSPTIGKGAVQDTYNLLGTSVRRLVRAVAE